ncbi:hypothetical protein EUGRSUZ_E03545 [Eucalyptus grandis]|uniref:Uncharacterized protein n=2 Tax=Eucalyptus grandis TaxID=71139 RepID=A0ACC3LD08_EUCGR|nr:hypothetical protein EUGRSUZ_E03545 [Eucalyptus grandis]
MVKGIKAKSWLQGNTCTLLDKLMCIVVKGQVSWKQECNLHMQSTLCNLLCFKDLLTVHSLRGKSLPL